MGKLKITNKIGLLGEDIAVRYLKGLGYSIIDRNWRQNYGEIDIIAKKDNVLNFFEVKAVSSDFDIKRTDDFHRPEDNVHPKKLENLSKTVQSYLIHKRYEGEWDFFVIAVYLNEKTKKAKVILTKEVLT